MRREDFPILSQPNWIYFDHGATSQKPRKVIDRIKVFYESENANVHRGIYRLSEKATETYESVREKLGRFLNLPEDRARRELIFTKGTTESINLMMQSYGMETIGKGDCVAVTRVEHHSNFVPWQALAQARGARFEIVECDERGVMQDDSWEKVLSLRPKIVAMTAVSNVTGQVMPVEKWAKMAKAAGAQLVLVDAAQAVCHQKMNLQAWEHSVDAVAFSSHKMCGPTGVGVLWCKEKILRKMRPYQFGGDMILEVGDQQTTWSDLPSKFEAGTPPIASVVGLGAAVDYLSEVGMVEISSYEAKLTKYVLGALGDCKGITVLGPPTFESRSPVFSLKVDGVHPHDLSTFLDAKDIAVRAGHHCAQPLLRRLGLPATLRASLSFTNTTDEIDRFVAALKEAQRYFQ